MAIAPVQDAVIRLVRDDAFSKPGEVAKGMLGEPDIAEKGEYKVHTYSMMIVPPGTTRAKIEIDLKMYCGQEKDTQLVQYGLDISMDLGMTWPIHASATAGDNPVPKGFPPTTSTSIPIPENGGKEVLVRPFCGAKLAVDVGVKVVFS